MKFYARNIQHIWKQQNYTLEIATTTTNEMLIWWDKRCTMIHRCYMIMVSMDCMKWIHRNLHTHFSNIKMLCSSFKKTSFGVLFFFFHYFVSFLSGMCVRNVVALVFFFFFFVCLFRPYCLFNWLASVVWWILVLSFTFICVSSLISDFVFFFFLRLPFKNNADWLKERMARMRKIVETFIAS